MYTVRVDVKVAAETAVINTAACQVLWIMEREGPAKQGQEKEVGVNGVVVATRTIFHREVLQRSSAASLNPKRLKSRGSFSPSMEKFPERERGGISRYVEINLGSVQHKC